MTQPIFEPTTQRTESKLGFGSDQLFRRPAPQGGSGDYEIPMGERHNTLGKVVPSGTSWTQIPLQTGQVTIGQTDVSLITDGLEIASGLWIVTGRVFWLSAFTTGYSQILVNSTGTGSVALMSERQSQSDINREVIAWPVPAYPTQLFLWARQTSGSDKEVNSGLISAARLFGSSESFGAFS